MRFKTGTLVTFFVLTALMAYGASHLKVEVDQTKYLPSNFESVKWEKVVEKKLGGSTKTLIVVVEANDVTKKDVLDYMNRVERNLKNKPYVKSVRGAPDVLKQGPQVPPQLLLLQPGIREILEAKKSMESMFVSPDHKVALITVQLKGNADYKKVVPEVRKILHRDEPHNVKFADVTGPPAVNYDFYKAFLEDLPLITAVVATAVAVILAIDFRRWWAPVLGLIVILSAVAWVLGGMYWLGVTPFYGAVLLTVVLVLGVGIDYVIFCLTRFKEEYDVEGRSKGEAIKRAFSRAGKAVVITGFTATAGFAALCTSKFGMIAQIGATIVAGILAAMTLTIFVLPTLLAVTPTRRHPTAAKSHKRWSFLAIPAKKPLPFILALIVLTGFLGYAAAGVKPEVNIEKFLGHSLPSLKAKDILKKHMNTGDQFVTVVVESKDVTSDNTLRYEENLEKVLKNSGVAAHVFGAPDVIKMEKMVSELPYPVREKLEPIVKSMKKGFVSKDHHVAAIRVQLKPGDPKIEGDKILKVLRHHRPPAGVKVGATGTPIAYSEMHRTMMKDMRISTAVSAAGVLTVPTVAFKNPVPAIFGLMAIGAGVTWALGLIGGIFKVIPSFITMQTMTCVLLGIGMDYCVFLASRYVEERRRRRKERDIVESWVATMERAGPGVLFSGLTSAAGFLGLLLAHVGIIKNMGLYQGIGVLSVLSVVLTGFPALYVGILKGIVKQVKEGE